MKVSDIMTRRVISIAPEATVVEAIQTMLKNRISGIPVIDANGRLVGMLTEGDFLRRSEIGTVAKRSRWLDAFFGPAEAANDYVLTHGKRVRDVMTSELVTIRERASLDEVVNLMEARRVKRLPVMRGDKVVGIVSRANLMHAVASLQRGAPPSPKSDAAIRDRIRAEIERQHWANSAFVEVVVRDGIVDLWGTVSDAAQGQALCVLAEAIPGVRQVQEHLRWAGDVMSVT